MIIFIQFSDKTADICVIVVVSLLHSVTFVSLKFSVDALLIAFLFI